MEDDLSILGVTQADRKKLETMGFTTLEHIAVLAENEIGIGRRGEQLIQRARNILANRNIQCIRVNKNEVCVEIKVNNDAVVESVLDILGFYDYYLSVKVGNTTIRITPKNIEKPKKDAPDWEIERIMEEEKRIQIEFERLKNNAQKWTAILLAKEKDELARKGISMKEKEIVDFANQRGFGGFWQNVFSEIKGNDVMKIALSVAIFSSFDEPVHVLVLGEPGSAKSLSKEIITRSFRDLSVVGGNVTRAGLVCNLANGEPGVLAYSNEKLVLVDEFDKIPKDDVVYCYELLSNGKCTIHSARVHEEINSRFIMIAFANPKSEIFSDDPMNDIGLSATLMSRFALIVRTEDLSDEEERDLLMRKFYGESEIKRMPEHYDQWVKLARLHKPKITASEERVERYLKKAKELMDEHRLTPIRRDYRMGDYARWIPMAIGRAEFSDITDLVLEKAEDVLVRSMRGWKNVASSDRPLQGGE